jgi:hypothetical protein
MDISGTVLDAGDIGWIKYGRSHTHGFALMWGQIPHKQEN